MRTPGVVRSGSGTARRLIPLALLAAIACSSEPSPPPGGAEAAGAAYEAADRYGSSLKRGMDRGRRDRAGGDLRALSRLLEQHMVDSSAYPEAVTCPGLLQALTGYRGPGLPASDPWGNPYDCRSWGQGYCLRSSGPDGEAGTDDDVLVEGGQPS